MNVRRAALAAAIQVVATIVITTLVVTLYITVLMAQGSTPLPESEAEAVGSRVGHGVGIGVGIVAAFVMGWWGARGVGPWFAQGVLIGSLIAVIAVAIQVIGGDAGAMTAVALLYIPVATAGAAVAGSRPGARQS